MNNFCVYVHILKSTQTVIYVGSGTKRRAKTVGGTHRSAKYEEFCKVHKDDIDCIVIFDNLSKDKSLDIEQYILQYVKNNNIKIFNKIFNVSRASNILREDYSDFVEYDETSPTSLRFTKDVAFNKYTKGRPFGTLNKRTGYFAYKNVMLQRIVYALVHGECPSDKQVNHIDGNKQNNKIDNLELVTVSENALHAFKTGLRIPQKGSDNPSAILNESQVLEIYDLFWKGLSNEEIAQIYNIEFKHVSLLRNGKRWIHLYNEYPKTPFPKSFDRNKLEYKPEQLLQVKELCEKGELNLNQISKLTGVERSSVSRLRSGELYRNFFDWWYNTQVQNQ